MSRRGARTAPELDQRSKDRALAAPRVDAPIRPTAPSAGWWPVAIFVIAFAARALFFLLRGTSPLDGFLAGDEEYYLAWARRIAAGDWWGSQVFEQAPLYPYLLAVLFRLFGESRDLAICLQLAVGGGTAVLVYACARRLAGEATGRVAGLTAALYGPSIFHECMLMKTFLGPFLTSLWIYSGLRYADCRGRAWLACMGLATGVAALVNENHILLSVPAAVWVLLGHSSHHASPRRRAADVALLAIATCLPIAPVAIRNRLVGGEWVAVTAGGGEVFYIGHFEGATGGYTTPEFALADPMSQHEDFRREATRRAGREMSRGESSRYWFAEGLRAIRRDPMEELRRVGRKTLQFFGEEELSEGTDFRVTVHFVPILRWLPTFGWLLGPLILGCLLAIRHWRVWFLPLATVAVFWLSAILIFNLGRFRLSAAPACFMLASFGVVWIFEQAKAGHRAVAAAMGLLAVALSVASLSTRESAAEDVRLARVLGFMEARRGDHAAAEKHIRRAIDFHEAELRSQGDHASRNDSHNLAALNSQLAQVLDALGRHDEAVIHHRLAIELPQDAAQLDFIRGQWAAFLRGGMRRGTKFASIDDPRRELDDVLRAIVAEESPSPRGLAIAALWAQDAAIADSVDVRLREAGASDISGDVETRAWLAAARAAVAARRGDAATRDTAIAEALSAWPEHPLRDELLGLQSPPTMR